MGQNQSQGGGGAPGEGKKEEKKKKYEPPIPPPRVGRKQRKAAQSQGAGSRLPTITPSAKCKLRLLKLERVKDYLLMEEEFVRTQELLKPQEERNQEDRSKAGFGKLWTKFDDLSRDPFARGAWMMLEKYGFWAPQIIFTKTSLGPVSYFMYELSRRLTRSKRSGGS
eukprot:gene18506-25007_t